jgi:hypothetical protein
MFTSVWREKFEYDLRSFSSYLDLDPIPVLKRNPSLISIPYLEMVIVNQADIPHAKVQVCKTNRLVVLHAPPADKLLVRERRPIPRRRTRRALPAIPSLCVLVAIASRTKRILISR